MYFKKQIHYNYKGFLPNCFQIVIPDRLGRGWQRTEQNPQLAAER